MSAKVYDFTCTYCGNEFEKYLWADEVDGTAHMPRCPKCNDKNTRIKPSFGGYKILGNNSSSVTPKQAGSFKKKL